MLETRSDLFLAVVDVAQLIQVCRNDIRARQRSWMLMMKFCVLAEYYWVTTVYTSHYS